MSTNLDFLRLNFFYEFEFLNFFLAPSSLPCLTHFVLTAPFSLSKVQNLTGHAGVDFINVLCAHFVQKNYKPKRK